MIIAPSILNADNLNLEEKIDEAKKAGISRFHIDIMDGHFVPNLSFGPELVKDFKKNFRDTFAEVHLMSDNPNTFIPAFTKAGADLIGIHYEAMSEDSLIHWLDYMHEHQIKAGVVLNPDTPASVLKKFATKVDQVLVMTVYPGFGGQKFIDESKKITEIQSILNGVNSKAPIEVDGGINNRTIDIAKKAGASVFVVGSYIFGKSNVPLTIKRLSKEIENEGNYNG